MCTFQPLLIHCMLSAHLDRHVCRLTPFAPPPPPPHPTPPHPTPPHPTPPHPTPPHPTTTTRAPFFASPFSCLSRHVRRPAGTDRSSPGDAASTSATGRGAAGTARGSVQPGRWCAFACVASAGRRGGRRGGFLHTRLPCCPRCAGWGGGGRGVAAVGAYCTRTSGFACSSGDPTASACRGVHLPHQRGFLLPVPVVEYCAPVQVVSQPPAPADDFISPAPAAVQFPTPVSEYISPASVVFLAPAQLEESAVSQSPAPVVEHLSPAPAVFHAPTDLPARA